MSCESKKESTPLEDNYSIVECLTQIQSILKYQSEVWLKSDQSKTADKIENYDVAIELLITFVKEKNLISFLLTFKKYSITMKGIRYILYYLFPFFNV